MPGLEDNPHATGAQLVEDEIVADDQPPRLALQHRLSLVTREPFGAHQRRGQPRQLPGRPGREPLELLGPDQTKIYDRAPKLLEVHWRRRPGYAFLGEPRSEN